MTAYLHCPAVGTVCGSPDCGPAYCRILVINPAANLRAEPEPAGPRAQVVPCTHLDFTVHAEVTRLARSEEDPAIVGYAADLRFSCAGCGMPFLVYDLPAGLLPGQPTASVDGTELRVPLRPKDAPAGFGLDLPGYTVRQVTP